MTSRRDREFEEFVVAAWPRLRRAAFLLTHDSHEAEDLVQSALMKTYVRWSSVEREGTYSYVHRAVVNGYIDSVRRRRPVPVEEVQGDVQVDSSSIDDRSELVQLLAPLSPRERAIIVWRYYFDAPEREVALALGIAPGTVRGTASRALGRLRAGLSTIDCEGKRA